MSYQFSIGKETTHNVPVARNTLVVTSSDEAAYNLDYQERQGCGLAGIVSLTPGFLRPTVRASVDLDKEQALTFWTASLGNPDGTGSRGGNTPWRFVPRVGALPSYTAEVFQGVAGQADLVSGCVCESMSVKFQHGRMVSSDISFQGAGYPFPVAMTSGLTAAYSIPYSFERIQVTINGNVRTTFSDMTLNIKNALEQKGGIRATPDSLAPRRVSQKNTLMVDLSGSLDFEDATELQLLRNRTQFPIEIRCYGTATDAGTNDVQTVTISGSPTGGNFTLTFKSQTTTTIAYNAAASVVQAALAALSTIGDGNVTVTGSAGGPYTVTFGNNLGAAPQSVMTASGAGLTGGTTPSVAVAHTTPGVLPARESEMIIWLPACYIDSMPRPVRYGDDIKATVTIKTMIGTYSGDSDDANYPIKVQLFDRA